MDTDHEIISTVILSLLLIPEGQLSVTGNSTHIGMHMLGRLSLSRKRASGLNDRLNMTLIVLTGQKTLIQTNK